MPKILTFSVCDPLQKTLSLLVKVLSRKLGFVPCGAGMCVSNGGSVSFVVPTEIPPSQVSCFSLQTLIENASNLVKTPTTVENSEGPVAFERHVREMREMSL
jgi:hypothetical protein